MKDVTMVVRHYTEHNKPIREHLPTELLKIMHTLVLPVDETIVPSHAVGAVINTTVATLWQCTFPGSVYTTRGAQQASDLLRKLCGMQVYTIESIENETVDSFERELTFGLNHVLQLYGDLAASRANNRAEEDMGRQIVQEAEQILIEMSSISDRLGPPATQPSVRITMRPDVVSFNTVMKSWANSTAPMTEFSSVAAQRAEAILDLLLEITVPTTYSYDAVLSAWGNVDSPQASERGIQILQNILHRHAANSSHPLPADSTFVTACKGLTQDPSRVKENIDELLQIYRVCRPIGAPVPTILLNSILMACSRVPVQSQSEYFQMCRHMAYVLDTAQQSGTVPDSESYTTLLSSLGLCVQRYGNGDPAIHTECCSLANKYLQQARHANVASVHVHNDTLVASRSDVRVCKQLFRQMQTEEMIDAVSCRSLMEAYEYCTGPNDLRLAQEAEDFLLEVEAMGDNNMYLRPDTSVYNSVISSWIATRTKEGTRRADMVLRRVVEKYHQRLEDMQRDPDEFFISEMPNTTSFHLVLTAYARERDSVQRVEGLLQQMEDMQLARARATPALAKKMAPVEPNIVGYNIVLDMYARLGMVRKAEDLLKRIDSVLVDNSRPDVFSYQAVLKAYGVGGAPATKTLKLLDLAKKIDKRDGTKVVSTRLYNVALNAIVNSGTTPSVAKLAEDVFFEMKSRGNLCAPDKVSWSTLMKAQTQVGTAEALEKANEYLQMYVQESSSLPPEFRVDTICFNTLITPLSQRHAALKKANNKRGGEPRQQSGSDTKKEQHHIVQWVTELFEQMKRLSAPKVPTESASPMSETVRLFVAPDRITYNEVMAVLPPTEAAVALREMIAGWKSGKNELKPDSWSFGVILQGIFNDVSSERRSTRSSSTSQNKNEESVGDLAVGLLLDMEELGNQIKTTVVAYNVVLKTLGQLGQADKANALLDRMWKRFDEDAPGAVQPDRSSHNITMMGYFVEATEESAKKAERILTDLEDRWNRDERSVRLETPFYT